ncbi:hypothetical protein [Roseivirga echinicomitans]|nr:hypothetical protein [Roseivirga echinicomitans]
MVRNSGYNDLRIPKKTIPPHNLSNPEIHLISDADKKVETQIIMIKG